jgi:hypothetical protein
VQLLWCAYDELVEQEETWHTNLHANCTPTCSKGVKEPKAFAGRSLHQVPAGIIDTGLSAQKKSPELVLGA